MQEQNPYAVESASAESASAESLAPGCVTVPWLRLYKLLFGSTLLGFEVGFMIASLMFSDGGFEFLIRCFSALFI